MIDKPAVLISDLIKFLESKKKEEENTAEEYIQEYDNPESSDRHSAKAQMCQELIDHFSALIASGTAESGTQKN